MGLNPNIRENAFVNRLNWSVLSCHDKALAIASEALIPHATLYFILFKFAGRDNLRADSQMGIGKDSYYRYLMKESGLNFQRVYRKGDSLREELKILSDNNEVAVFLVNTKYQTGARLAGKKDHPHFMVYKGYSEEGYHFVDEDWSKEYWRTRDTDTDVCYIERVIPFEELEALTYGIKSCHIFDSDSEKEQFGNDNYFIYYRITCENTSCLLEDVQKKFEYNMREYLADKEGHYGFIIEQMDVFKEKLASRRAETIQEVNSRLPASELEADRQAMLQQEIAAKKDELFAIRNRFIYPYESELIGAHADFLYSIWRVIQLRSNSFENKAKWIQEVDLLWKQYGIIKMQISRGVILTDTALIDRAIELFQKAFEKECLLYQDLLDSSWQLEGYIE